MGKTRRYKIYKKGKKRELISWIQNRCIKCGRFLGKHGQKYCKDCYDKKIKEYDRKRNKKYYRGRKK